MQINLANVQFWTDCEILQMNVFVRVSMSISQNLKSFQNIARAMKGKSQVMTMLSRNLSNRNSYQLTLGARGFFFRSEAAIVSGEAAIVILPREKNPLDAAVTNLTSMRF